jgi:hypothetical protein
MAPGPRIGAGLLSLQWESWTEIEQLFPHLMQRCGRQTKKASISSSIF